MCNRLREDDDTTGFAHNLPNVFLIALVTPDLLRAWEITLVAAGDDYQSAVTRIYIGELECQNRQATVHLTIAEDIVLIWIKTWS